jgi:hypothetical protein
MPPPAAAAAAIEWLGQSIHKRPDSVHIMVVPRLMTSSWRKRLSKTSDLFFTISLGTQVWSCDEHGPLICAVCLPLSQHSPWSHQGTTRTKGVFKRLCEVWQKGEDFLKGVFCANFWARRGHWGKCEGIWCGTCFTSEEGDWISDSSSNERWRTSCSSRCRR